MTALLLLTRTTRGFAQASFRDRSGASCSIQDSSIANEACLWLGRDEAWPLVAAEGEPWKRVVLPRDAFIPSRMHLTREQVAALLPLLQRFVDAGSIAPTEPQEQP